jgi:hypothetical protein
VYNAVGTDLDSFPKTLSTPKIKRRKYIKRHGRSRFAQTPLQVLHRDISHGVQSEVARLSRSKRVLKDGFEGKREALQYLRINY